MFWFLLLPLCTATLCPPEHIRSGLSQCSERTRSVSAYFYGGAECAGYEVPPPVHGLQCNATCAAGHYLDFDQHSQTLTCSKCPAGTFSTGGGVHFGGNGAEWSDVGDVFVRFCGVTEKYAWVMDECTNWQWSAETKNIRSGKTQARKWVKSELVYSGNIVKPGGLSLRYHSQTRMYKGMKNGLFEVFLNSNLILNISETGKTPWRNFTIPLAPGLLEAKIVYTMYNAEGYEDLRAEISELRISGTKRYSTVCEKCKNGGSEEGAEECRPCPVNYYFDGERCVGCQTGFFAPAGSVGASACQRKLPCTNADYSAQYSGCIGGVKNRTFTWHTPITCDIESGVSLPKAELNIPCELCPAGSHYAPRSPASPELFCTPCPTGSAVTQHRITDECSQCPGGTYSLAWVNLTHWTSARGSFSNECYPYAGSQCSFSQGWLVNGDSLSSGRLGDHDCYLVLSITAEIVETDAFVQFRYSLLDVLTPATSLSLEIDGDVVASYSKNIWEGTSPQIPLKKGTRNIQLIYHHATINSSGPYQDLVFVHWFAVKGTESGGAPTCHACPSGHISSSGSGSCRTCPMGYKPDEKAENCYQCPENTYQDGSGSSECLHCASQTIPNRNLTNCISTNFIQIDTNEFLIENLTGVRGGKDGYADGICSSDQFQLQCKGTFYGPISTHEGSFYVSVMNPSRLDLPLYETVPGAPVGYAYGVVDKARLRIMESRGVGDVCVADSSKVLANLGSVVTSVTGFEYGFNVTYGQGSVCDITTGERFSSTLQFLCDKRDSIGFPELAQSVGCEYQFTWRSRLACRICHPAELTLVRSDCSEGVRFFYYLPRSDCILSPDADGTSTQACSVGGELVRTTVFVALMLFVAAMVVVAAITAVCYCNVRRKYQRLRLKERSDVVVSTHQAA